MKFVGYIPFGYPTLEKSLQNFELYIEEGCTAYEISFPVYNAEGESPMIVDFMNKALDSCSDYDKYMDAIRDIRRRHPDIEINFLVFMRTILSIGMEKFMDFYKEVGTKALICPHSAEYEKEKQQLRDMGASFFSSFHYTATDEELQNCLTPNGIVYMTAYPPEWAPERKEGFNSPKDVVDYLRSHGVTNPIYAGVGINSLERAREIRDAGADGFFVGGSIMSLTGKDDEQRAMIKAFIEAGK